MKLGGMIGNKRVAWRALLGMCALLSISAITRADAPATQTAEAKPAEAKPLGAKPADEPWVKVDRAGQPDPRFLQMHAAFLRRGIEAPVNLLFLGDSITEGWFSRAPDVWKEHYWQYTPANFGIGGDRTEHVLWRIAHGELDKIAPKVVVLLIGTNNIGANYSADETTAGVEKVVDQIHQKLPQTKVLLLGIFPRGTDAHATSERSNGNVPDRRAKITQVNQALAKFADGTSTRYFYFGDQYLDANGNIPKQLMADGLHPTHKGYEIWASAMQPVLDEMMK